MSRFQYEQGDARAKTHTVSRRVFLAAPLGAALATASAPVRAQIPLPYDIRRQVPGSEHDPERIQCVYDSINRTVMLLGDVRFGELFSTPLATLAEQLNPRLDTMLEFGLLDNPDTVRELTASLVTTVPGLTLLQCYSFTRNRMGPTAISLLTAIRREGINIPLPACHRKEGRARARVLNNLAAAAPGLTYRGLLELSHRSIGSRTMAILNTAKALSLCPDQGPNDRCCDKGGGPNLTDVCVDYQNLFCAMAVRPNENFCNGMSDVCPGDRPGRKK